MKKILFTISVALLLITNVNAQEASFGVKGGVNFASILGESVSGLKGRTSFNAGAVAEIKFSETSSFQAELLYSGQGFTIEGFTYDGETFPDNTVKLDYLNIPLLYKYYFTEGFSVEVGPQIGFLLSANADEEPDPDFEGELKDNLTAASFDIALGLSYKLENGINFSARYVYGVTDIWKGADDDIYYDYYYYYDYGQRNGVFQLSAGYFFN